MKTMEVLNSANIVLNILILSMPLELAMGLIASFFIKFVSYSLLILSLSYFIENKVKKIKIEINRGEKNGDKIKSAENNTTNKTGITTSTTNKQCSASN